MDRLKSLFGEPTENEIVAGTICWALIVALHHFAPSFFEGSVVWGASILFAIVWPLFLAITLLYSIIARKRDGENE